MKFLLLIIIIIVLGILFYLFKYKIVESPSQQDEEVVLPFRRKEFLMNIPERRFFEELTKNIPDNLDYCKPYSKFSLLFLILVLS